ncbi:hypothetical protein ACRPFF_11255, partial [Neisseria sp. SLRRB23]
MCTRERGMCLVRDELGASYRTGGLTAKVGVSRSKPRFYDTHPKKLLSANPEFGAQTFIMSRPVPAVFGSVFHSPMPVLAYREGKWQPTEWHSSQDLPLAPG